MTTMSPTPESAPEAACSSIAKKIPAVDTMSDSTSDFKDCDKHIYRNASDEQIDVVLAGLVDGVLLSCHKSSQRHLPFQVDLHAHLSSAQCEREPTLTWLLRTCEIMNFRDEVLYATVLTLDRYCMAIREPVPMDRMQQVLMGVLCTTLKTTASTDDLQMPLRYLLGHLCRQLLPFEEILRLELEVLQKLDFQVTIPSPLEFLDALCARLMAVESVEGSPVRCLANFLLQLSLFSVSIHYRRPHAVLATSAIYLALCTLQAAPAMICMLLKDVTTICCDIKDVHNQVGTCALELQALWTEFASIPGSRVPCLLEKFKGQHMSEDVMLNPPANRLPHPRAFAMLSRQLLLGA